MLEWDILNYLKKWRTNLRATGLGSSLDAGAYYNVSLTITDIQMVLTNALTVNDYGTQGNTNFDYKYEMHN